MLTNLSCRRFAPLLVPYGEGTLEERIRDRVSRHLASCPSCRDEAAAFAAMAELLRANPPAPAAPAPDLWARLETQIRSEDGNATAAPPRLDAPGAWVWEWRSFARAFAATAVPVAAVVACFVFVLHNDAERVRTIKLKERAAAAIKTPHPLVASGRSMERVVIRLAPLLAAPKIPSLPVKESAVVAALSAKTADRLPSPSAMRAVVRVAAREPRRDSQRNSILLELRQLRQSRLVADASHRHVPTAKLTPVAPLQATKLVVKAEPPKTRFEEDRLLDAAIRADAPVRDADEVRVSFVAWNPDNAASERDVPADSVAEVMEQLRRHQSLFSYGDH
jgi:hypothetical protein